MKTADWTISTKLGTHILYSSRSACIDPEGKRSKVKVTCYKNSRRTVASDYSRCPITMCCAICGHCRRGSACRYDCRCFLVAMMLLLLLQLVMFEAGTCVCVGVWVCVCGCTCCKQSVLMATLAHNVSISVTVLSRQTSVTSQRDSVITAVLLGGWVTTVRQVCLSLHSLLIPA